MGWVGILLQRLYETPLTVPPLDRYALVLIDEIDAHMHPSWQRSLVDTLKELFPNVQFIATTHSPLIVAGLEKSEIYTIRREGETGSSESGLASAIQSSGMVSRYGPDERPFQVG